MCVQYIFEGFNLRDNDVLMHHDQIIHIPPKELGVLRVLLNANGGVVSKEQIFKAVWHDIAVSDESITRCIYTLRRILCEDKSNRFIETVYGKGYRLRKNIAIVSSPKKEQRGKVTSVAIFPFITTDFIDVNLFHNSLVQGMSKYTCYGVDILPVAVTKDCNDFTARDDLIHRISPDYYFTGQAIAFDSGWRFFIELVQAGNHRLIEHQKIVFEPGMPVSILINHMINMLVKRIPSLQRLRDKQQQMDSLDAAVICMNGRQEMCKFTPESLEYARSFFAEYTSKQPQQPLPYCYLAECYISMALLGLYDQQLALEAAMEAVNRVIELDPESTQGLGLLGLLCGLRGEDTIACVLFKQAKLLLPDSADIYYYHALFHFLKGNTTQALLYVEHCLKITPDNVGANMLMLWIIYCSSTLDAAIKMAVSLMEKIASNHPFLISMMALFVAINGDKERAEKLLQKIPEKSNVGYLAVNNIYIRYLIKGDNMKEEIIDFLRDVDITKTKGSYLPLILIAYGRSELEYHWQQLNEENNIWSNIWKQDPRLADFKGLKSTNELAALSHQ